MNHQANLLDSRALPLHRGLRGVVRAVVAGAEGFVVVVVVIVVAVEFLPPPQPNILRSSEPLL